MTKRLTGGMRPYIKGMEGFNGRDIFSYGGVRNAFKDIMINGVGIKKIDSISDNVITINTGYSVFEDHVVYEVYNDQASVLTTLKKIDANNFKSSEDLSAISGVANLRVPPIGLEISESSSTADFYKMSEHFELAVNDGGNGQRWLGLRHTETGSLIKSNVSGNTLCISKNSVAMSDGGFIVVNEDYAVIDQNGPRGEYKVFDNNNIQQSGAFCYPSNPIGNYQKGDKFNAEAIVFAETYFSSALTYGGNILTSSASGFTQLSFSKDENMYDIANFIYHDGQKILCAKSYMGVYFIACKVESLT